MLKSKVLNKVFSVLSCSNLVNKYANKSMFTQALDIIKLYRVNPTCNIFDYYKYGLSNVERNSPLYTELLGTGALEAFSRSLNPRNAVSPAWDKLLFAMICDAYKLPSPQILALYKPQGLFPDFIQQKLSDISQLKAFLIRLQGPIFVKPVKGHQGQGAFFINTIDPDKQLVTDKSNTAFSFDEFIDRTIGLTNSHRYKPEAGVLFQRPVVQHQAITKFTKTDTPSGLRLLVLNTGAGPYIHRAIWKIIAPGNISDNFSKGKHGNMVAQVDVETGKVSDAVNGYWPKTKLYSQHPVSGRNFSEFSLPLWQQVVDDVLRASRVIDGMGAMHWDIIITETGAVLLELNDIGSTEFLQLHGQGLIDQKLKAELKRVSVLQKGSAFARFVTR